MWGQYRDQYSFGNRRPKKTTKGEKSQARSPILKILTKYSVTEEDEKRCPQCDVLIFHRISCPLNEAAKRELAEYTREKKDKKYQEKQESKFLEESCVTTKNSDSWLFEYPSSNACSLQSGEEHFEENSDQQKNTVMETTETILIPEVKVECPPSNETETARELMMEENIELTEVTSGSKDNDRKKVFCRDLELEYAVDGHCKRIYTEESYLSVEYLKRVKLDVIDATPTDKKIVSIWKVEDESEDVGETSELDELLESQEGRLAFVNTVTTECCGPGVERCSSDPEFFSFGGKGEANEAKQGKKRSSHSRWKRMRKRGQLMTMLDEKLSEYGSREVLKTMDAGARGTGKCRMGRAIPPNREVQNGRNHENHCLWKGGKERHRFSPESLDMNRIMELTSQWYQPKRWMEREHWEYLRASKVVSWKDLLLPERRCGKARTDAGKRGKPKTSCWNKIVCGTYGLSFVKRN
ncbi:hypothetical protein GE061_014757 [Apolygus lucorum]|uniref:Uncharacterized protein n=1 Tax=Apolygus lucorum TaxID=248454 RepID=A0A8S9XKB6_APOLU|nr:hypothetical protein GE061_014757 [Apolygus lucorum]